MRDLEAIMQREQDLAALASEAAAAVSQAEYDRNTDFVDMGCTDLADSMELCDTSEMLDMFSEYYVADKADMEARQMQNIVSPFGINDEAFSLGYMGGSNQSVEPRNDFGNSNDDFDVAALVRSANNESNLLLPDM